MVFQSIEGYITIDTYGAIVGDSSSSSANKNSNALYKALQKASASSGDNRIVLIPSTQIYYINALYVNNLKSITLKIEGKLIVTNDLTYWPKDSSGYLISALHFVSCHYLTITGNGIIDGQGWNWWNTVVSTYKDTRPRSLIDIQLSYGITIEGITLINSPQYYVYLYDLKDVIVRDLIIQTDAYSTQHIATFPVNTDGIDILAINVVVYNITITNYDDSIAIKPCKSSFTYCKCSSNITVRDITIYHGVGISIGSVPPNSDHNCVRDVLFTDITLYRPFKGIYIKTNPGDSGTGEITNITYTNIKMYNTLWWAIYIGPQQQSQPGETDTGCMTYPVDPYCPTQPRVTISDIFLNNVNAIKSFSYFNSPGIIRCDASNPCKNINFNNVDISQSTVTSLWSYSFLEGVLISRLGDTTTDYFWRYIVENVVGLSSVAAIVSVLTYLMVIRRRNLVSSSTE
eukprot:gene10110-21063_t